MNATTTQQAVAVEKHVRQQTQKAAATEQKTSWFADQARKFEAGRFGWMALMLTFQTCLGSVACMYIQQSGNIFMLSICMAVTMASNAIMIAQGSAKLCVGSFYVSVLTNSALILINLLS